VALAIGYGGTTTYESIMRDRVPATFHGQAGQTSVGLAELVRWDGMWFGYVTGDTDLASIGRGRSVFTPDEYAHMADVRQVFIAFRIAGAAAAIVAFGLVLRVSRRDRIAALALIRDSALAAAAGVAAIAGGAVVAFDPLFLLFHEVFFPQGNFLFPADSNLIALYPDEYWYGVTLRVGISFACATALIALAATATLRQARR
jgi:Protein of unknown function (DUF1461)